MQVALNQQLSQQKWNWWKLFPCLQNLKNTISSDFLYNLIKQFPLKLIWELTSKAFSHLESELYTIQ